MERIYFRIKAIMLNMVNKDISVSARISRKSNIKGLKKIQIGNQTRIHEYTFILANGDLDKGIKIGDDCTIHEFTYLKAFDGEIIIGNNCTINAFVLMYGCSGGIKIGNGVRIATGCSIVANSHVFTEKNKYICEQGVVSKGVIIEDDVWLGSGVRVMDGIRIGKGSVIGANSVVTKNIPQYAVAVGVPAKIIKYREDRSI